MVYQRCCRLGARIDNMFLVIIIPVATVVLAVLGYFGQRLVARNDNAHEKLWGAVNDLRQDFAELKAGQSEINGKLDILVNGRGKSDG